MKNLLIPNDYRLDKNKTLILKSLTDLVEQYLNNNLISQKDIELLDEDLFCYFNFLKQNNRIPNNLNIEYDISYLNYSKTLMIIFSDDLSLYFNGIIGLSF